jgi:hypothetical protein
MLRDPFVESRLKPLTLLPRPMQMLQRASVLAVCAGVAYSVYRMTTSEKKGGKTKATPTEEPAVPPAEAPLSPAKPAPLVVPTGPMV